MNESWSKGQCPTLRTLRKRARQGAVTLLVEASDSAHPLMVAVAMWRGEKLDLFHVGYIRAFFVWPANTVLFNKDHAKVRGVLTQGFGGGNVARCGQN